MLPPKELHISELQPGAQLRIALKAGYAVEPDETGLCTSPRKGRRARGYSRTTFYAYLISNDPQHGSMRICIQDIVTVTNKIQNVIVSYKNILVIQQVIPYGRPVVETAPKTHPGAQALGTKMAQLYPQPYLIPVTFIGK